MSAETSRHRQALRSDPDYYLTLALENNHEAIAQKMGRGYGMWSDATPEGVRQVLGQLVSQSPDHAASILMDVMAVDIIDERLTPLGREVVYSELNEIYRSAAATVTDFAQGSFDGDVMAYDVGNAITIADDSSSSVDILLDGLDNYPNPEENTSGGWDSILAGIGGLLPGILGLFGVGPQNGGASQDQINQILAAEQAKKNQMWTTVGWILGALVFIILVIVIIRMVRRGK